MMGGFEYLQQSGGGADTREKNKKSGVDDLKKARIGTRSLSTSPP
jgi:hypothetical protein